MIRKIISKEKPTAILLGLVIIVSSFLMGPVMAWINRNVLKSVVERQGAFGWLAALGAGLAVAGAFGLARKLLTNTCERRLTCALQDKLIYVMDNRDYFDQYSMEEVSDRISVSAQTACEGAVDQYASWTGVLSALLFSGVYILSIDRVLMTVITSAMLLLLLTARRAKTDIRDNQEKIVQKNNLLSSMQWEYIHNKGVASFLNYDRVFRNYQSCNLEKKDASVRMMKKLYVNQLVRMYGTAATVIAAALAGGILCMGGRLSYDALFGILTILPSVTEALIQLPGLQNEKHRLAGAWKPIQALLDTPQYEPEGKRHVGKVGSIRIKEVSFSFPNQELLQDVDLTLHRGKVYVLTGESGCGKSTLLKLLIRLYHPAGGDILYDGHSVDELERASLWRSVFYSTPTPLLFSASLRDNILGREPEQNGTERFCSYEEAVGFLSLGHLDGAGVLEPDKLSSGEKQKIAIARMFCSACDIWLCDEPTSALDEETERVFMERLSQAAKSRGLIVLLISHRKGTFSRADVILRLENRKIEEVLPC